MKRTLIVLVVCCICLSLSVPFVSASSFDTGTFDFEDMYVNIMPYVEDSYITFSGKGDTIISFPDCPISNYYSFDILFYTDSTDFSIVSPTETASVISLGGNLYRATGNFLKNISPRGAYFYFYYNNGSYFNLLDAKYSLMNFEPDLISYTAEIDNSTDTRSFSYTGTSVKFDLHTRYVENGRSPFYFIIDIPSTDAKKYNYIELNLVVDCIDISSIKVYGGSRNLDFHTNIINLSTNPDAVINHYSSIRNLVIYIDTSKYDINSSYPILVHIDGLYSNERQQWCFLNSCFGYVTISDTSIQSWLNTLYVNLKSWFSTQFSKLDQVISELKNLNGNDAGALNAQQTQEEINVSVNNQLVGAVEDWNTNIEVVETGYDLAVTKTTPALVWLSSLADGIFNGMGWFGNVYFLVGLISVLMLLLSKSGLASKIGSISRRRGD